MTLHLVKGNKNPGWYTMAAKGKSVEISIYENIGQNWYGTGVTAKNFEKQLKEYGEIQNITLRINSYGGSVFDGNAIYNILRSHPASVHTIIDGVAASIASVIALAGDTIEMPENSMMMIHNPMNIIMGNAIQMRKMADDLDKIKDSILNTYASKTGLEKSKLSKLMDDETWMTADEAVELGFADEVTKAVKAVASISPELAQMFHNIPEHLVQTVPQNVSDDEPMEEEPMTTEDKTASAVATPVQNDAAIADAVAKAMAPQLQRMNEERLANIRDKFSNLSDGGKITPAQNELFGQLAESLMGVNTTVTFKEGDAQKTGTPIDMLFALANSMNHSLLTEVVAAGDAKAEGKTMTTASGKNWKPDLSNVPEAQKKCLSGVVMDQYIKQVVMPANPGMSYADAAMLAEKDENLAEFLNQYDYIPD